MSKRKELFEHPTWDKCAYEYKILYELKNNKGEIRIEADSMEEATEIAKDILGEDTKLVEYTVVPANE